jgi:hypothetical protein
LLLGRILSGMRSLLNNTKSIPADRCGIIIKRLFYTHKSCFLPFLVAAEGTATNNYGMS